MMLIALTVLLLLTGSRSSLLDHVDHVVFHRKSEEQKIKAGVCWSDWLWRMPFVITTIILAGKCGGKYSAWQEDFPSGKHCWQSGLPKEPFVWISVTCIAYKDYFQSVHIRMPGHDTQYIYSGCWWIWVSLVLRLYWFSFSSRWLHADKRFVEEKLFVALFIPILINSFTEFGIFNWNKLWYFVLSVALFFT